MARRGINIVYTSDGHLQEIFYTFNSVAHITNPKKIYLQKVKFQQLLTKLSLVRKSDINFIELKEIFKMVGIVVDSENFEEFLFLQIYFVSDQNFNSINISSLINLIKNCSQQDFQFNIEKISPSKNIEVTQNTNETKATLNVDKTQSIDKEPSKPNFIRTTELQPTSHTNDGKNVFLSQSNIIDQQMKAAQDNDFIKNRSSVYEPKSNNQISDKHSIYGSPQRIVVPKYYNYNNNENQNNQNYINFYQQNTHDNIINQQHPNHSNINSNNNQNPSQPNHNNNIFTKQEVRSSNQNNTNGNYRITINGNFSSPFKISNAVPQENGVKDLQTINSETKNTTGIIDQVNKSIQGNTSFSSTSYQNPTTTSSNFNPSPTKTDSSNAQNTNNSISNNTNRLIINCQQNSIGTPTQPPSSLEMAGNSIVHSSNSTNPDSSFNLTGSSNSDNTTITSKPNVPNYSQVSPQIISNPQSQNSNSNSQHPNQSQPVRPGIFGPADNNKQALKSIQTNAFNNQTSNSNNGNNKNNGNTVSLLNHNQRNISNDTQSQPLGGGQSDQISGNLSTLITPKRDPTKPAPPGMTRERMAVFDHYSPYNQPVRDYLLSMKCFNWAIKQRNKLLRIDDICLLWPDHRSDFNEYQQGARILRNSVINILNYDEQDLWEMMIRKADFSKYKIKKNQCFPQTFLIDLANKDFNEDESEIMKIVPTKSQFYIQKTVSGMLGDGIRMIMNIQKYKEEMQKIQTSSQLTTKEQPQRVLQTYISQPLLINGRKGDFRVYFTMFCTDNYWVFLYHPGYLRFSLVKYTLDKDDFDIHTTHFGNYLEKMQDTPQYEQLSKESRRSHQWFQEQFKQEYNQNDQDVKILYFQMKQILTAGFLAGINNGTIKKTQGNFHTFGCDVLIDQNFQPWFIQPNALPGIDYCGDDVKDPAVKLLSQSLVDFIMDMHDNWQIMDVMAQNELFQRSIGAYEIVYNQATNFNILNEISP